VCLLATTSLSNRFRLLGGGTLVDGLVVLFVHLGRFAIALNLLE
jgi:hypothetical protein